jgi:hypothetical protein
VIGDRVTPAGVSARDQIDARSRSLARSAHLSVKRSKNFSGKTLARASGGVGLVSGAPDSAVAADTRRSQTNGAHPMLCTGSIAAIRDA